MTRDRFQPKPNHEHRLIRNIPTAHVAQATIMAERNGDTNFNFNALMRRLLAEYVDRRRERRPGL